MSNIINQDEWRGKYSEMSQSNPMEWMNVKLVENTIDTFEPVSHWWVCKDFMNEAITAKHTGKTYSIYGFICNPSKFYAPNQQEMYIVIKNVTDSWFGHMEDVVNPYLLEAGFPAIEYESLTIDKEAQVLLTIPDVYLHNTLFISQVLLFIRMANVDKVYTDMEGLSKNTQNSQDKPNYTACLNKPLKDFPSKLEDYIWYYNSSSYLSHSHKEKPFMTSYMHNCGVSSWGWE